MFCSTSCAVSSAFVVERNGSLFTANGTVSAFVTIEQISTNCARVYLCMRASVSVHVYVFVCACTLLGYRSIVII